MSRTPAKDAWMLEGGGEMGTLIGQFDWDTTPLGPPSQWSHSLRATVAMLLHSRHPMFLWWGPELIQIYNDAYMPSFGLGKHPTSLGQRGRDCWPEIWHIIGPQIDDVMRCGIASWHQDALVPIFRNGGIDEVYWTYGYSPVFDDDGSIGGTLVVCTETTERVLATRQEAAVRAEVERDHARLRQLTQKLRDSEAQFHLLAESIPQLAWSARADGYIDWYNQRWYDYTGTTLESVQGWGWRQVHDPDLLQEVLTRWQAALSAGEPFEMECPLRGRDGQYRWHLTQAMPFRDETGRIVRWFGTNTDIDASRRTAQERASLLESEQRARLAAELASRAKDEFLSTASHELRTPLNAILGWARMLQSGELPNSAFVRAVDSIERNARVQVRLIEDILDGSRIITGKLQLEIRPLDLTAVLQAALDSVRASADAKRIALTVNVDPDAAQLTGDSERLQQVIWNLANNAIKFTPKGGAVDVDLSRVGTDVQLTIKDNGEGIGADFLPQVFERFRQAEGSTTRRYGGLGLGLALVRHLVEAHGGTVQADSPGSGRGSTFTVRLPVAAVVADAGAADAPSPVIERPFVPRAVNLAGACILVVDDEADARDLVATVLRSKGAEVVTASSASEALSLIAARPFTAMVSDIGMPTSDGYELITRVRTVAGVRGHHLPAVALTAYSRDEDRRRALEAGFQAHVAKPVEPDYLLEVVARVTIEALKQTGDAPDLASAASDVLGKFARILEVQGLHEALRFLNSRASHRFTGIYQFDAPTLRNLALLDADIPTLTKGDDAPLEATYCSIVGAFERPFTTEDTGRDYRLREHPARESVRSYCGVLLRAVNGNPFGTLCHFDTVPRDVPVQEVALMEAVAPLVMHALEETRSKS